MERKMSQTDTNPPASTKTPLTSSSDFVEHVSRYPFVYWLALLLLAGIWIAVGLYYFGTNFKITEDAALNAGILIWITGLLHFVAGYRTIEAEETAAVFILGISTIQVRGAPLVTPPGLFRVIIYSRRVVQLEVPTEPEKVYRGDETKVPDGFKPPIRIPFANPPRHDTTGIDPTDPLHRRTTNEVSFFVRMIVEDVIDFHVRIGSMEEAKRQIEDMGVSLLSDTLTQLTPAMALSRLGSLSDELDNHIREKTTGWGVIVVTARIKLIELSHNLNSAIQDIAEGGAKAQATALIAEGERKRLASEGQGRADAIKSEIDARTKGMQEMAASLKIDPTDILGAETARAMAASPSDKIIVGLDGFKDLLGAAASMGSTFKKSENPDPTKNTGA